MLLDVRDAVKYYGSGANRIEVLHGINLTLEEGKILCILGPSGSGKSTFLNIIGGLDKLDSGNIFVNGTDVAALDSDGLSKYRRDNLGFIFQFYNLIPNLTVLENIVVCEYLTKDPLDKNDLLDTLGLTQHKDKFPRELSGGQQQRCAIARALIKNPKILLLDEPTGALDYKTSKEILNLLEEVNTKYKTTMLMVTHNDAIKDMCHKVIHIKDGNIVKEYENETLMKASDITW